MYLPNYKDGSIVNLMSSIKKALGGKHPYNELKILPSNELKNSKNIILIVLDGLGYDFLEKNIKGTVFERHLKGSITSVFPSTTGAAIPTFFTGLAPQQHAYTGWYIFLKELGVVSTILRFNARYGGESFSKNGIDIKKILNCKNFADDLKVSCYSIEPDYIVKGDLAKATIGKAHAISYNSLKDFFNKINLCVKIHNRRKYIYAYWDKFDSISHAEGVGSKYAKKHFFELCSRISKLVDKLKGTNTKIIITADHGFIDSTRERFIHLDDHPELADCLTLPLCGDNRVAYCYVHPSKVEKFENYIKTKLNHCCEIYKSQELIDRGFFGLFEPNPKLFDRVGDYTLIMKENYVLRDSILGSKKGFRIGRHSGVSKEEMFVPLVVIDC